MSNGFKVLSSGLIVVVFVLAACGSPAAPVAVPTQAAPATPASGATIANPASENCAKQGGKLTIEKRGDGGEFGVCWFEDALQCEEWALMRGECPAGGLKVTGYGPQGRYCAITGGQYTLTGGDMTNEKGTCAFKNGKTCDGADYFNGKCDAASAPARGGPLWITKADNGKSFDVAKGAKFTLTLDGNPTTGYVWETNDLNTGVVKQVGDYEYTSDNPKLPGSPGSFKFTFEGAGAGGTQLRLIYHRPFETDVAPAETFEVTINVK